MLKSFLTAWWDVQLKTFISLLLSSLTSKCAEIKRDQRRYRLLLWKVPRPVSEGSWMGNVSVSFSVDAF